VRGSKGGMQTAGTHPSIYCPKCGKPAARKELKDGRWEYMHFTKKSVVWHKEPEPEVFCDPNMCDRCEYIGEGDSMCDILEVFVLEDWQPTADYMGEGCPYRKEASR